MINPNPHKLQYLETFKADALLIALGFLSGLISMVKFIMEAMAGIERLEKEQSEKDKKR